VTSFVQSAVQDTVANWTKVTNKDHSGLQLNASQVKVVFADASPLILVTVNIDLSVGAAEFQWKLNATGRGAGTRTQIASSLENNLTSLLNSSKLNASLPISVTSGFAFISATPSASAAGTTTPAPGNRTNTTNSSGPVVAIASSAYGSQTTMIKGAMALIAALWV